MRILIVLLIFLQGSTLLFGQPEEHEHGENELAFIPGVVMDLDHRELAFTIHGHYLRTTGWFDERISIGAGFEYVTGDESHFTMGPVLAIKPVWKFIIIYSPGITFIKENETTGKYFSNHFELALEFEIAENMHLGPSAGANISGGDRHISFGLHLGKAF